MGWGSQTRSQKLLLSWDGSLGKGVLLSVSKSNGKSYSFCVSGQRASSEQNFEIRQSSMMSSLWLFCLFPTGDQGYHGPSSGQPYHLYGWLCTYPPPCSPILSTPHSQPWEMLGKKIITLNEGLAAFLPGVGIFQPQISVGEAFLN